MKNAIAATVLSLSTLAHAAPSADNYASVTNDWYQGNWTNVYELAQKRLAANTNDLVASHLMVSYDILFSDYQAISNSILRLVGGVGFRYRAVAHELVCISSPRVGVLS